MAVAGKIVSDALRQGYRDFLGKIHPDYFMRWPEAQKANSRLIQDLEFLVKPLANSWLFPNVPLPVSSKLNQKVAFYLEKEKNEIEGMCQVGVTLPITWPEPLTMGLKEKLLATRAMIQLFQSANLGTKDELRAFIDREILKLLSQSSFNHGAELTKLMASFPSESQLGRKDIERLKRLHFVRIDPQLCKEDRKRTLCSLFHALSSLEEAFSALGSGMPIVFVSCRDDFPKRTKNSIRISPEFTPEALEDKLEHWFKTIHGQG